MENISLEVRVVPYGKGKRLLQARDITRLNQLETVLHNFFVWHLLCSSDDP